MPEFEEKIEFIKKHSDEIKQVVSDEEGVKNIEAGAKINKQRTENILEQFETKVFLYEKPENEYESDAKRVLITAQDIMNFNILAPMIEGLKKDLRCRAIGLLADLKAGKQFEEQKDRDFKKIDNKELPVLVDALTTVKKEPYDAVITHVESPNSSNEVALFAGKSVFGAKKLYIINGGWVGFGSDVILSHPERQKHMESIDGIFCNDELAKRIIMSQFKEFPENKIFATGTPVVDNLEIEKSVQYHKAGREKLGIDEDALSVLYIGDSSAGYKRAGYKTDEKINEKTFEQTLDAMIKLADSESQRKFAFLVRPHPSDTNFQELFDIIAKKEIPSNLKVVSAAKSEISMPEASCAADIVASIISTENFMASLRGKKAIFLGYKENGLGDEVIRRSYSEEMSGVIDEDKNIDIVSSPEDFFDKIKQFPGPTEILPPSKEAEKSVDKILNIVLENKEK